MHKSFLPFIITITLSIFICLWQRNATVRYAYKISRLQVEYDKISSENDFLKLKINSMLALEKMDKIAREENLSIPDENSIVYIE
ncbi:MAG: hypothetical protein LBI98_01525 [Endomicrobium sp.]|nr:hypothetical protein [Endomicrobium sp.]